MKLLPESSCRFVLSMITLGMIFSVSTKSAVDVGTKLHSSSACIA